MKNKKWLYAACIVLQGLIYGLGNVLTKFAYESITPFWCLTIRFGLATVIFLLFFGATIIRELKTADLSWWLPAGLCMALGYITCNVALDLTTATTVGFLMALPVIFAPFFALVILKAPYRLKYLPIQILVVLGLYLFCSNGGNFSFGWGEALSLFTSIAVAGAFVFGERGLKNLSIATVSATQTCLTFLLSLIGAITLEPGLNWGAVSPTAWWIILYLALPCTCLAFALQNIALTGISSTMVSVLASSEPILTAAIAWVVLGETLNGQGLIGAALILICIVAATADISPKDILKIFRKPTADAAPSSGEEVKLSSRLP